MEYGWNELERIVYLINYIFFIVKIKDKTFLFTAETLNYKIRTTNTHEFARIIHSRSFVLIRGLKTKIIFILNFQRFCGKDFKKINITNRNQKRAGGVKIILLARLKAIGNLSKSALTPSLGPLTPNFILL